MPVGIVLQQASQQATAIQQHAETCNPLWRVRLRFLEGEQVLDEIEVEYRVTLRTTMRLPKGRYRLAHEIEEIEVPEDRCTRPVAGTVELLNVTRNGSRVARPVAGVRHPLGPSDAGCGAGSSSRSVGAIGNR